MGKLNTKERKNKKPLAFFRGCCYNESTLENRQPPLLRLYLVFHDARQLMGTFLCSPHKFGGQGRNPIWRCYIPLVPLNKVLTINSWNDQMGVLGRLAHRRVWDFWFDFDVGISHSLHPPTRMLISTLAMSSPPAPIRSLQRMKRVYMGLLIRSVEEGKRRYYAFGD